MWRLIIFQTLNRSHRLNSRRGHSETRVIVFKPASKSKKFFRLGIEGLEGSGKTLGALKLARGMCNSWSEIAVIDTENGTSNVYADLGAFQVCIVENHAPEKFITALEEAERQGFKVAIIDSASHEWMGVDGCLEAKDSEESAKKGNSYTAWKTVTPRHQRFTQAIMQSNMHTICTLRQKKEIVIENTNGKNVPKYVGVKAIQRDGFAYDLDVSFVLEHSTHQAKVMKDRLNIFSIGQEVLLSESVGELFRSWNNSLPLPPPPPPKAVIYSGDDTDKRRLYMIIKSHLGEKDSNKPLAQQLHANALKSKLTWEAIDVIIQAEKNTVNRETSDCPV